MIILFALYGGFLYLRPIVIYQMPINAWNREIWNVPDSTQKEESFVVYNSMWKNDQEIMDSIIAFNDRTISLDTISKYLNGYKRMFFKRTTTLNKHYQETKDGSDVIYDYAKERILIIIWTITDDTINIEIDNKYYRLPINTSEANLATSISRLQNSKEYLYYEY